MFYGDVSQRKKKLDYKHLGIFSIYVGISFF